jgi:ubiquinone/menaquinone biosynthesis C-methylase UbiE
MIDENLWATRKSQGSGVTKAMRRDWDGRARKNALHYIASWQQEWDLDAFLASGEEDYQRLVLPILQRCGISASGKTMVELGCGVGRMTSSFAHRHETVLALDISAEMLARARQIHTDRKNILWVHMDGVDLACLASGSVDFVFSYLVLQHLPNEKLAFAYIEEMLRVLRPGGAFLFQFNGSHNPTMNLRGRLAWSVVDTLWSSKLVRLSHATASLLGLDPAAAGRSWRGAAIDPKKIKQLVHSRSGEIREMAGINTPMTWCCGTKSH